MQDRPTWTPPAAAVLAAAALLAGCAEGDAGREPAPPEAGSAAPAPAAAPAAPEAALETETGKATYYADVLDRARTASGEPMDQSAMVAAHRRYPFGTLLRVTNLENDRAVRVRVIDRGPFGAPIAGVERVIDLSRGAAGRLGFLEAGSAPVKVEVIELGEGLPASS